MPVKPRLGFAVLLVVSLMVGFGWGFFSHRQRLFPFALIRAGAAELHLVKESPVAHPPPLNENLLLSAIGYVDGTFDHDTRESGVVFHDPRKASPGLNFYNTSVQSEEARLVDMDGELVYRWRLPGSGWMHTSLLPDGDVLAVQPDIRIVRVNQASEVIWELEGAFHHGLWVTNELQIVAMVKTTRHVPELHSSFLVRDDDIVIFDGAGYEVERISVLDRLLESQFSYLLPDLHRLELQPDLLEVPVVDLLHTNHVEVCDGSQAARSGLFAAGNLVVSMRNLNTVAILSAVTRDVLWAWGPNNLRMQHHPTLLDTGTLLIFNNGSDRSEVLEVNPLDNRIVWHYSADNFFSRTRGSNQRLANGNTLITESDSGHVIEVTPHGELAWEFANPDHSPDGRRLVIWRMTRFEASDLRFLHDMP